MPFKSEKQRRYLFANESEVAKKFAKDYNMGGVASMFRKRLSEGDDPFYEAWKKVYEQNPDAAAMNERHDEYLEKYKLEMSMQTSDAPMEETEETTEVVEETADPLLNLFQPSDTLASDQAMTTLFTPERPEGIMAAKGGHVPMLVSKRKDGKRPGYRDDDYDYGGVYGGGDTQDTGADFHHSVDTPKQTKAQIALDLASATKGTLSDPEEKYDTTLQEFYDTPTDTEAGVNKRKALYEKDYREKKQALEKKIRNNALKTMALAFIGIPPKMGSLVSFNPFSKGNKLTGIGPDAYELSKLEKDYLDFLEETKEDYRDLGVAEFHHAVDTPIQEIDQEILDILDKDKDDDDRGKDDGPTVTPLTLEVDEDYAQGEMLDFNMMSALDKIRANQAKRSGLVARDIIQDTEIMTANKGGLAGLFRVRNQ